MNIISLSALKSHAAVEAERAVFGSWLTNRLQVASTDDDCLMLPLDLANDVVWVEDYSYRPSSLYVQRLLQELGYNVIKAKCFLIISGWKNE